MRPSIVANSLEANGGPRPMSHSYTLTALAALVTMVVTSALLGIAAAGMLAAPGSAGFIVAVSSTAISTIASFVTFVVVMRTTTFVNNNSYQTDKNFEKGLNSWIENAVNHPPDEFAHIPIAVRRASYETAASRIKTAFYKKSSVLDLTSLKLFSLPETLKQLTSLRALYLQNNHFTTLPSQVFCLTQLSYLDASRNTMRHLDAAIEQLRDLVYLNLNTNELITLPSTIAKLSNLKALYVGQNHLSCFPKDVTDLTNLVYLCLPCNYISEIPDEIDKLQNLTCLSLSFNALQKPLPQSLTTLTRLKVLQLSHTCITCLPENMGQLSHLSKLTLCHNSDLKDLPQGLENCIYLRTLTVDPPLQVKTNSILDAIRMQRENTADQRLKEMLNDWDHDKKFDFSFLNEFSARDRLTLFIWLERLTLTKEFSLSQQGLTNKVLPIIQDLNDSNFKAQALDQINMNNENCGDRTEAALNELYFFWQLQKGIQASKDSLPDKLKALINAIKQQILMRSIAQCISNWTQKKRLSNPNYEFREAAEVQLYYQLRVSSQLGLHTAVSDMLYAAIGNVPWMSVGYLTKQVNEQYMDVLLNHPVCLELAQQDPSFKAVYDQQHTSFTEKLDSMLENEKLSEQEKLQLTRDINTQRDQAFIALLRRWVEENTTPVKQSVNRWPSLFSYRQTRGDA